MIDWSYGILSAKESLLFSRLSLFVGGWRHGVSESVVGFGQKGYESDHCNFAACRFDDDDVLIHWEEGMAIPLIHNSPMPVPEQPEFDNKFTTMRAAAGDTFFQTAWDCGQIMILNQAIALALDRVHSSYQL